VPKLVDLAEIYANADLYTLEGRREITGALAALAHDDDYLPATEDLPPDAEISFVTAPVFGPDTTLLFAIALLLDGHRGEDIPALSRALLRAAARVMAAIDGRQPDPRLQLTHARR
jgi:hypothetical protein